MTIKDSLISYHIDCFHVSARMRTIFIKEIYNL